MYDERVVLVQDRRLIGGRPPRCITHYTTLLVRRNEQLKKSKIYSQFSEATVAIRTAIASYFDTNTTVYTIPFTFQNTLAPPKVDSSHSPLWMFANSSVLFLCKKNPENRTSVGTVWT